MEDEHWFVVKEDSVFKRYVRWTTAVGCSINAGCDCECCIHRKQGAEEFVVRGIEIVLGAKVRLETLHQSCGPWCHNNVSAKRLLAAFDDMIYLWALACASEGLKGLLVNVEAVVPNADPYVISTSSGLGNLQGVTRLTRNHPNGALLGLKTNGYSWQAFEKKVFSLKVQDF